MEWILGRILPPPTSLQRDPSKIKSNVFISAANPSVGLPLMLRINSETPGHHGPSHTAQIPVLPVFYLWTLTTELQPQWPPCLSSKPEPHFTFRTFSWLSLPREPSSVVTFSSTEGSDQRPPPQRDHHTTSSMFTAVLSMISKVQKQPKCPLMDGWMDKDSVVLTYNGISFSLEKEGNPATCDSTDGSSGHSAQ